MNNHTRLILLYSFILLANPIFSQTEICDNGMDDDGDGLIDCFDDDCCDMAGCNTFWFDSCVDTDCLFQGSENFTITREEIDLQASYEETSLIVAGDLNNDGLPEIITTKSNQLVYIDPVTKIVTTTPNSVVGTGFASYAMADLIPSQPGIEILMNDGFEIRALNDQGVIIYSFPTSDFSQVLSITDFNQDGLPEFHSERIIYNGQTGTIINTLAQVSPLGAESSSSMAVDVLPDSFCANCDGLEFVSGGYVFAVDILTGSYSVEKDYTTNHPSKVDYTAVVDWDLDGDLDLFSFSSGSTFIIHDILTGAIIASNSFTIGRYGAINIGNLDNDPEPEISLISQENNGTLMTFDNDLTSLWQIDVDDNSGFTGMTLFDFDANGQSEIVYRDEDNLRIINGANGANIQLSPCLSVTGSEYPIIIDYDNDNEAEIITICDGSLTAFSSGAGAPWANCRPVWNQRHYFNVHINDDLSIPRIQQLQHLPEGNSSLNGFLNQYQTPEYIDFDLELDNVSVNASCTELNITVCNISVGVFSEPISISYYNGDPSINSTTLLETKIENSLGLAPCVSYDYALPSGYTGEIWIVVNDAGGTPPFIIEDELPNTNLLECDYTNNTFSINVGPCQLSEICNNGIDDDGDGDIDCDDNDCSNLELVDLVSPNCGVLNLSICNTGGTDITDIIELSIYESTLGMGTAYILTQDVTTDILSGDCIMITALYPMNYTGDLIVSINDNGTGTLPIDPNMDGNFRVLEECQYLDNSLEITITQSPILLDLGDDVLVCDQSSYTIDSPDGFSSYVWNNVSNMENLIVNATGNYTLEVTDACGQSGQDNITVTFDQEKVVFETIEICTGDSLFINNTWIRWNDGMRDIRKSIMGSCDSVYRYDVTPLLPTNFNFSETICSGDSFYYSPMDTFLTESQQYSFTITNSIGCDSLLTINIEYSNFDFLVNSIAACPGMNDGSLELVITDQSLLDNFIWSTGESQSTQINGLAPATYVLNITDINGCTYQEQIELEESDDLSFDILFEDASCDTEEGILTVMDDANIISILFNNTLINTGEPQSLNTGDHDLLITSTNGCEYEFDYTVIEYEKVIVSYPDTIYTVQGVPFQIMPIITGPYIYDWGVNDLLSCTDCPNPILISEGSTSISLNVFNSLACDTTLNIQIIESVLSEPEKVYIPNTFRPNSSLVNNQTFKIFTSGNVSIPISMSIYDRWGNLLYQSSGLSDQVFWDGKFKEDLVNPGVYTYNLIYEESGETRTETGNLVLIR